MAWNPNEVTKKGYSTQKRIPMAILCDISSSMEDVKEILNENLKRFIKDLKEDKIFEKSVDLLVIFFNGEVKVKIDFLPLEKVNENEIVIDKCVGYTDTGKALLEALRLLEEKKMEYKREVQGYYQPKMFLLTDGYPVAWKGAPDSAYREVKEKYDMATVDIKNKEKNKKLSFMGAGLQRKSGSSANIEKLKELSEHVICISEDIMDLHNIEIFFDVIEQTLIQAETPISDVIDEFMGW